MKKTVRAHIRNIQRYVLKTFFKKHLARQSQKKIDWAHERPKDIQSMYAQEWIIVQPKEKGYPVKMAYKHGTSIIEKHLIIKAYARTEAEAEQKLDILFAVWVAGQKKN